MFVVGAKGLMSPEVSYAVRRRRICKVSRGQTSKTHPREIEE
jgi:hypothetical protein